ncbi:MAG: hypothetical protein OXE94_04495 [Aestuariivita sp.]|nr:hypothetical protein [Aestuariivita sp.]
MPLANTLSDIWKRFQEELLPNLALNLGPMTASHQRLFAVLDLEPVAGRCQNAFRRSWLST